MIENGRIYTYLLACKRLNKNSSRRTNPMINSGVTIKRLSKYPKTIQMNKSILWNNVKRATN